MSNTDSINHNEMPLLPVLKRPMKPCRKPGCKKLTSERFCDEHKKEEMRKYNQQRDPASKKAYGYQWQKKRKAFLAKHPFCVICGNPSNEVDHIIPIRLGCTDQERNLQALCKSCHSRKTANADGRWTSGDRAGLKSP